LVDDPILWHRFRLALLDAKVVTNFGVDQILNKFILERRADIEKRIIDVEKAKPYSKISSGKKFDPSLGHFAKPVQERRKTRVSVKSDSILKKLLLSSRRNSTTFNSLSPNPRSRNSFHHLPRNSSQPFSFAGLRSRTPFSSQDDRKLSQFTAKTLVNDNNEQYSANAEW